MFRSGPIIGIEESVPIGKIVISIDLYLHYSWQFIIVEDTFSIFEIIKELSVTMSSPKGLGLDC